MSVLVKRHLTLQDVALSTWVSTTGQGAIVYGTPVTVAMRIAFIDEIIRGADGEEIKSAGTFWIDSEETLLPVAGDRIYIITRATFDRYFIVLDARLMRSLQSGAVDHVTGHFRREAKDDV
jgi:hypothetical protein